MKSQSLATPLRFPVSVFKTVNKMDDYHAPDMLYGDLSQYILQNNYRLNDICTKVNPFTHPDRIASARMLFDEFRMLSGTFSFAGEYQSVIRTMITHMQCSDGQKFTDKLLDKAMAEHDSMEDSLIHIKRALIEYTNWERGFFPQDLTEEITKGINKSVLPRFNNWKDRINGLGISVHATWATHITLESLEYNGQYFRAKVHYRIQDHFGLDDNDIRNIFYRQFRIFRIWFTLQRWENYGYKPFISELNVTKIIEGHRDEKV